MYPKNNLDIYDAYFFSLKSLEFEKAKLQLKNLEGKEVILLEKLANTLYQSGRRDILEEYNKKNYITNSKFEKATLLLLLGYNELYLHPLQSKSYEYFSQGYYLSKEIGYAPITKQFILGLLELFHWEILSTNELHKNFLKELYTLSFDKIDLFWYELYKLILNSKTINKDEFSLKENFCDIENIIDSEFSKYNNLLVKYYYEKAIYAGFEKDHKKARKFHKKTLNTTKSYPFMRYMTFGSYIRLSAMDAEENNFKNALKYLDSSRNYIDHTSPLRSQLYIHRNSAKYYFELKKYDSAYQFLHKSIKIEHKLKYNQNTLKISELNVKLDTAEKEKKIIQLLNTNLKTEANRLRNRNLLIGSISILIVGSIIVLLVYKNTKRKQRIAEQEREIEIQKTEKLLKDQELTAIDAMISGQEKERQRLANELHDNLGSTLATVKLHFQHLTKNRNNSKTKNIEELYTKTDHLLEEAYQKVRTIAHEKNSGVMANQGLLPAIKKFAKKASNTNTLQIEVQDYGLEERLDNGLEISIFRMIQELITNIIKHANATEVHISLTNHDSLLNIIIEDNGKGFDSKVSVEKDGMGLKTIEKRIEYLEGTFEIDSTIGKGTNIIINIPI